MDCILHQAVQILELHGNIFRIKCNACDFKGLILTRSRRYPRRYRFKIRILHIKGIVILEVSFFGDKFV
jgi:hypothetical protein